MNLCRKKTNIIARLCCILFLLALSFCGATRQPAKLPVYPIILHLENTNLDAVFAAIQQKSVARFSYDRVAARNTSIPKAVFDNIPLNELLESLQQYVNLSFLSENNHIIVRINNSNTTDSTIITGVVLDGETGEPVGSATVKIGTHAVVTNEQGRFREVLPWGNYTAEISYVGYATKKIGDIRLGKQPYPELSITLDRSKDQLATVTVTSSVRKEGIASHYLRQKNAPTLTDGISAEQIARTPDNNMGQALKRVTGITMASDKYPIIRGLSDRYNQGMIDGVTLPSTRMNRRDFSFDAIPAEVVSSVVVNKTATPDVSAEFSGGQISVNTLDVPNENFTVIGMGSGYNDQSTGKDFYRFGRWGKYDYIGFDDKSRSMPSGKIYTWRTVPFYVPPGYGASSAIIYDGQKEIDFPDFDPIAQSKKFSTEGLKKYRYTALPLHNGRVVLGRVYALPGDMRIGFTAGVSLRNSQTIIPFNNLRGQEQGGNYLDSIFPSAQETQGTHGTGKVYRHSSILGSVLNVGIRGRRFRLGIKNIFTSLLEDELYDRFTVDFANYIPESSHPSVYMVQQPTVTQVHQHLLEGDYRFSSGWQANFGGSLTRLRQDMKDRRILQYNYTTTTDDDVEHYQTIALLGQESALDAPQRMWTSVDETDYNWRFSISKKIGEDTPLETLIKLGYNGWNKKRDLSVYSMQISTDQDANQDLYSPYHIALDSTNMGFAAGKAYYSAYAETGGFFTGQLKNHSIYLMADQKWKKKFRFIYGLRAEYFNLDQRDNDFLRKNYNDSIPEWAYRPNYFNDKIIDQKNWRILPSVNVVYSITPKINIRGAYSRTAIRPDFRESSYFGMYDPDLNGTITGRKLVSTTVDNADLRFEWYPSSAEVVTLGIFYKYMQNPIELMQNPTSDKGYYIFINQGYAKNYGIEMEFRKSMDFITPAARWLQNLVIFGNGSIIRSKVAQSTYPVVKIIDGAEAWAYYSDSTVLSRPLIGQVPWVINAGVGYQEDRWGLTVSYNRTGYRTNVVDNRPQLTEYEWGRSLLDAQIYARFFKKRLELNINAGNLLNQYRFFYQNINGYKSRRVNGRTVYERDKGNDGYKKSDGDRITYREMTGRTYSLAITYRF